MELSLILLVVTMFITKLQLSASLSATLEQTIPGHNAPVCVGKVLVYTCTSRGEALGWQENNKNLVIFDNPNQINTTKQGEEFMFRLVNVTAGDPPTFVSTATVLSSKSDMNGSIISCFDGAKDFQFKETMVAAHPSDCMGSVSCKVSSYPNDKFPVVIATLKNMPADAKCVEGYMFVFGNESKYVAAGSLPSANFTINKELGLTYANQKIFTVDAENRTGEQSCSFGITKPNQLTNISFNWTLDKSTMTMSSYLEWNQPSLTLDNCLDPSQLLWRYRILLTKLTNETSSTEYTTSNTFIVIDGLSPSSQYKFDITPVIHELGISGNPFTLTTATGNNESSSSSSCVEKVLTVVFPWLVVLVIPPVAAILGYKLYQNKHAKFSLPNSAQQNEVDSDDVSHLYQKPGSQTSMQVVLGLDEKDFVRKGFAQGLHFRSRTWNYQSDSDDVAHQTSTL